MGRFWLGFFLALIFSACWQPFGARGQNSPASPFWETLPARPSFSGDSTTGADGRAEGELEREANVDDRVDLRTFQSPNLVLPAEHWLGNWAGLRPRLEDSGISSSITWVSDLAGNPVGGVRQGFTECENLGADFMADLQKIAGISDAKFHVSMSQRSGTSLSNDYIGNAFNVQQVYGGETFHLVDVEYIQRFFDNHLSFHGGRIAAGDDFLSSPYYWFFMSNGIDGNPVGIFKNAPGMSGYPNATWGARLRWRPTDRSYIMGGIYNGDPAIRDDANHGADFSIKGPAFLIIEAGYQRNGLPEDKGNLGTYKVGAYYDANTFTDFNGQLLGSSASLYGLNSTTTQGNWGYYALFDQVVAKRKDDPQRNVGIFTSIIVSPNQEISTMPFFCNGGVIWRGPLAARPTDSCGFAVVYGNFSDSLRSAEKIAQTLDPGVDVQGYEMVLEWSYRFRMRQGALYFQPDLQYVIHPNGVDAIPDALVVGCQMGINF